MKEETLFLDHFTDGFCKTSLDELPAPWTACFRAVIRLQSQLRPRNNSWSFDKHDKSGHLLSDNEGPDLR